MSEINECTWCIGGMILTKYNQCTQKKKPVPVLHYSPQISHGLAWNCTLASALRDTWITAWALTWLLVGYLNLSLNEVQRLTPCIEECNYSACPFQINKASVCKSWLWIRCYWKLTNCHSVAAAVTLMAHYTQPHL